MWPDASGRGAKSGVPWVMSLRGTCCWWPGHRLHVPWVFAAGARPYFANKNRTDVGLRSTFEKEYDLIAELGKIATDRKIAISQPFSEGPSGRTEDVYPVLLSPPIH